MSDIEKAKKLLSGGNFTCVLCKGDTSYTSTGKGVSPMLTFLENGTELRGFSAADKIVGKAAAMLFVCAGVTEVFAEVMSKAAVNYLKERGIACSYGVLTDKIINRKGDGLCPMELAVMDIDDEKLGFSAIKNRFDEIRRKV